MKNSKIIAVDVDLCVVDSLTPWLKWFKEWYDVEFTQAPGEYNYDLVPRMEELLFKKDGRKIDHIITPFDFWRSNKLYDNLLPIEGSQECLSKLYEQGHNIIFVSKCVPSHEESKRNFLKKHFPFARGFISTGDKQYVKYDVLIDDHIDNINTCRAYNPTAEHIMIAQVTQSVFGHIPEYINHSCYVPDWNSITIN